MIEIQIALEEEFEIEIDPIQVVESNEFAGIVDYIHDLIRPTAQRGNACQPGRRTARNSQPQTAPTKAPAT